MVVTKKKQKKTKRLRFTLVGRAAIAIIKSEKRDTVAQILASGILPAAITPFNR